MEEPWELFTEGILSTEALIDGLTVSGNFDENYQESFDLNYSSNSLPTEGKNITFLVQSSKIPNVSHGSDVEIDNRRFEVVNIRPLDDGKITSLVLKEVD